MSHALFPLAHRTAVLELLPRMLTRLRRMFQVHWRGIQGWDAPLSNAHTGRCSGGETAPEWLLKIHPGACHFLSKGKNICGRLKAEIDRGFPATN